MRVSEYFQLGREQPALDFVDVDVFTDVPLFIDPRAIRLLRDDWGHECRALIQNFFSAVLAALRNNDTAKARMLLEVLHEPNETHFGLSRGRAQGRGLGHGLATDVASALAKSEAMKSGLLQDLEDTILMVEGVASDIVSDITTNIIREPLARYTQYVCDQYQIPTVEVASGPIWNPHSEDWEPAYLRQPQAYKRKLLLVPKIIARRKMDYDPGEYYRDYILQFLREMEMSSNSELVRLLKSGKRRVDTKDLMEKYGTGKKVIAGLTSQHPELLEQYRADKANRISPPLEHVDFAEAIGTDMPDWDGLLSAATRLLCGEEDATAYHRAVERLLSVLFAGDLAWPCLEHPIHNGRKRIDITYTNVATRGFFHWLGRHYNAPYVFVECKNYSRDPQNPELDQIAGRFSERRGTFGIIVCRELRDRELFLNRCQDTVKDNRGYIIPLDDTDLANLVNEAKSDIRGDHSFISIRKYFDSLVM